MIILAQTNAEEESLKRECVERQENRRASRRKEGEKEKIKRWCQGTKRWENSEEGQSVRGKRNRAFEIKWIRGDHREENVMKQGKKIQEWM